MHSACIGRRTIRWTYYDVQQERGDRKRALSFNVSGVKFIYQQFLPNNPFGTGRTLRHTAMCDGHATLFCCLCLQQSIGYGYVETRFHRTRQEVALGNISLEKVGTKENVADVFTKALRTDEFNNFMAQVFGGPRPSCTV